MNPFIDFLSKLGFSNVRQTSRKDAIELVVSENLKEARRLMKGTGLQFMRIDTQRTRNSTVEEFYAVQNRTTVGRVRLEAFASHSVVQLTNLEN